MKDSSTVKHYISKNYCVQRNPGRFFFLLNNLQLLGLIFCFFDMLICDPHPRDVMAPCWTLMSPCTIYKASTHHLIILRLSALKIRGIYIVPRRYWSNRCNLRQLSLSGSITFTSRKATDVWMSFISLRVVNISCDTLWCNDVACYLSNIFLSSSEYTSNIWSPVGVWGVFMISSRKSAITFLS